MGLPDELQAKLIGMAVQVDAPIVSSDSAPGDKYHIVLDTARKSRVPHPLAPFRDIPHLLAVAKEEFFKVNTFHIDVKGVNTLYDDIRMRPHIRHIEYLIPAEEIIARWEIDSDVGEIPGVDELKVIEQFPTAFPSLKTVTIKLELSMKQLQDLPRLSGADKKKRDKVAAKRLEIVTAVLRTYLDMHLVGEKFEIRKYVHLVLGTTWAPEPAEIDGRGKRAAELYREMLDWVNTVARV
jgi:hypothetical protein